MAGEMPSPQLVQELNDFRKRYAEDDNEWWRLQSGEMQNLFEAALEVIEYYEEAVGPVHRGEDT